MNRTNIEWCDYTWNPVTGCLIGCDYCYARVIANRFKSRKNACADVTFGQIHHSNGVDMPILSEPKKFYEMLPNGDCSGFEAGINSFPAGFTPTFHKYRLDEPQKVKKPSNIFVVSAGDLFGSWVPDEWIQAVFDACDKAPWHNYLFLTKNGQRYEQLGLLPDRSNFWYGTTRTGANWDYESGSADHGHTFISIEPLLDRFDTEALMTIELWDWVIIGAETGKRKGKVVPKRGWIQEIVNACEYADVPVFMKDNLQDAWGAELIRQWPEGLKPATR